MKTNFLAILGITIILTSYSGSLAGQKAIKARNISDKLPKIELVEKTPQKYFMVTNGWNYDIYGNFMDKKRITGEYTRGLQNNKVKWNNVTIAHSNILNEPFPEGEKQNFMENFTYNTSDEMLNESFFKDVPEADVYMKSLIWDMSMFESFAWIYWDKLKLNVEYSIKEIKSEILIEGLGTFKNKDIKVTWIGITKKNDELCAIIKYKAMCNPVNFNVQNTTLQGRSHYWGDIYVSLNDKQIEYGELHEDVVLEIKNEGLENYNIANALRNITIEKFQ